MLIVQGVSVALQNLTKNLVQAGQKLLCGSLTICGLIFA